MKYALALMLVLAVASPTFAFPAPAFRTVAISGQQAPGTPAGTAYASFSQYSLNNMGQVVLNASLNQQGGITTANDSGIWSEGSGQLELVAREGDPASGAPASSTYAELFALSGFPIISDSGSIVWRSSFNSTNNGAPFTRSAIWSGRAGSVNAVAINGEPAPGVPGAEFIELQTPLINASGDVGFVSSLAFPGTGGANAQAFWSGPATAPSIRVRTGDQLAGLPAGVSFQYQTGLQMNNSGELAFYADLAGGGVSALENSGIWVTTSTGTRLVARDGGQPPGTSAGTQWSLSFNSLPHLNSLGQVAFASQLLISAAPGVDTNNNAGVWSEGNGSLSLVVRKGDQAPGTPSGATFNFFNPPFLSDSGHVAFLGTLQGNSSLGISSANDGGIWSDASGQLSLVAREGDPAPGMPNGMVFSSFSARSRFLAVNSFGHVAFLATASALGLPISNGIWAQDPSGILRLLVKTGDLFEVGSGDQRTVQSIQFQSGSAGGEGLARGFNDQYELAFLLRFTDGSSGIFTAQVAVPEPAAGVLLMLAFAGVLTRRERRG